MLLGRYQTMPIVLYNDGILPASVKLELVSSALSNPSMAMSSVVAPTAVTVNGFTLVNGDKYVTIDSKQTCSFDVTFKPLESKVYTQGKINSDRDRFGLRLYWRLNGFVLGPSAAGPTTKPFNLQYNLVIIGMLTTV
jgi:hypothetical protein